MKQIQGKAKNLPESLIEKVIITPEGKMFAGQCLLYPIDNGQPGEDCASFALYKGQPLPNAGDILLLEPEGVGTILYEIGSPDNSILITERCNCCCIMCPQPPQSNNENLVNLSLKMLPLMDRDTQVIGITGGEPTMAWEGLTHVLKACKENIPQAAIQLLTNGRVLKSYDKVEELRSIGLSLNIGIPLYGDIDTLHDAHMGVKGAFWDTVEGIFNLERASLFVEIRTVVTRLNYLRLLKWAEFIYRTFPFAGHIAIMGLEPIGSALKNIKDIWVDPVNYASHLEKAVRHLNRRNMNVSVYNHQLCTLPQTIWEYCRKSISGWKTIYMPECDSCEGRLHCGGFFRSAKVYKSKGISPVFLKKTL